MSKVAMLFLVLATPLAHGQPGGVTDDQWGELSLTASSPNAELFFEDGDDEAIPLPATLRHPPGTVRVRVRAPGHRVLSATLEVIAGQVTSFHADLDKLSSAEREFFVRSKTHAAVRSAFFWSGVSLLTVGVIFFIVPGPASSAQDTLYERFSQARTRAEGDRLYAQLAGNAERAMALRTAGWVVLSVGVAASVTSMVMWLVTPQPPARSRLSTVGITLAPGGLGVVGTFQ